MGKRGFVKLKKPSQEAEKRREEVLKKYDTDLHHTLDVPTISEEIMKEDGIKMGGIDSEENS